MADAAGEQRSTRHDAERETRISDLMAKVREQAADAHYWKAQYAEQMDRPCHVMQHEDQEIRLERLTAEVARLKEKHRKEISAVVSQAQYVSEAAEARVRALEEALAGTHFHHKAYEPLCPHCQEAMARLDPPPPRP